MKSISLLGLALLVGCEVLIYTNAYWTGWLYNGQPFFNFLLMLLLGFLGLLILFIVSIISLCQRKNRLWMTGIILVVVAMHLLNELVLGTSDLMTVRGIRDHVLSVSSLDDLRTFAHSVHRDLPETSIYGEAPDLDLKQAKVYRELQKKYPFLTWKGRIGGPFVVDSNDEVTVFWGSGFGHWGFSVNVNGSDSEIDTTSHAVIHMSKDICFFNGD